MADESSNKLKAARVQIDDASSGDQRLVRAQAHLHMGPLDSPDTLAAYHAIDPSLPNRLIAMVETQAAHRRAIEKAVVDGDLSRSSRGQVLGFIVTLAGFALAGYLGKEGHPTAAAVLGTVNLVALVSIFAKKDAEKKAK